MAYIGHARLGSFASGQFQEFCSRCEKMKKQFRYYSSTSVLILPLIVVFVLIIGINFVLLIWNERSICDVLDGSQCQNPSLFGVPNLAKQTVSPVQHLSAIRQHKHFGISSTSPSKLKTILYWNAWNREMGDQPLVKAGCPVTACLFTSDLTLLNQSDVVLFSVETTPDFVVDRMPHQRFVFFVMESPTNTENHPILRENRTRYNYFNWTMTYRRDSDIVLRDFLGGIELKRPPNDQQYPVRYRPGFDETKQFNVNRPKFSSVDTMRRQSMKRVNLETLTTNVNDSSGHLPVWLKSKTKLVAWFVSHCDTPIQREEYARQLGQHVPVDLSLIHI